MNKIAVSLCLYEYYGALVGVAGLYLHTTPLIISYVFVSTFHQNIHFVSTISAETPIFINFSADNQSITFLLAL